MKTCSTCKESKPLGSFHKNARSKDKHGNACKTCMYVHVRKNKLKAFGLTLDSYAEMVEAQGGRCAICLKPCSSLHVDHDHETGRIRGLLCGPCNRGIGCLGDTLDDVRRALIYLGGEG